MQIITEISVNGSLYYSLNMTERWHKMSHRFGERNGKYYHQKRSQKEDYLSHVSNFLQEKKISSDKDIFPFDGFEFDYGFFSR